jgi:simple sugar transport system substrate-binding protein
MPFSEPTTPRFRNCARHLRIAIPAVVAVLALSACTPGNTADSGASTTGATSDDASGVNIVVIGGASDDPFFSAVKRGVDDGTRVVEAAGGKVTYLALENYDNLGPDVAQLTRTALSQDPSAIAVPDWVPEAQDPAIQEVIDAGVPVLIYNSGTWEAAEALGALTYIGTDEELAGEAAGEALGTAGASNVLCVNTVPGAQNLEARCAGTATGIEASGGSSTQLALPSSSFGNQTAVTEAIKAALLSDTSVDAVVTVGGSDAESAAAAIEQAGVGDSVQFVGFNLDGPVLPRIKAGGQLAAIDQQPYSQGFLTVTSLFSYVTYGIELPTKPILTGPLPINSANVDAAIRGAEAGVR